MDSFVNSDYNSPRPAVLIATNRSGSTFLLNALDSHPQIGCERSEPLDPHGYWSEMSKVAGRRNLLRFLWKRPGYQVAMFKLSYRHVRWVGIDFLKEIGPCLIHLHRQNVIRMGISALVNTAVVKGEIDHPIHTFTSVDPISPIRVEPGPFVYKSLVHLNKVKNMKKKLKKLGLPLLLLSYEDLVGGEGMEPNKVLSQTAETICKHLDVESTPLISYTRRVNPQPLSEIVENWTELAVEIAKTKLGRFLEGEG